MRNDRLISLRTQANMTQAELAKAVGLSQGMIASIEAGRREPSLQYGVLIAKHFKVSVEWLFFNHLHNSQSC